MHLDVGEVDRTSHILVPAMTVQSDASLDDLFNCSGHSAAVSSHDDSSIIGKNDCIGGFGNQKCHGSLAPLA